MYQPLLPFDPIEPTTATTPVAEPKGVVYTRPWVVDLLLDLVGYTAEANLVDNLAVEPSAGAGAFLIAMVRRLVASCRRLNRPLTDCAASLLAYELDDRSATAMRQAILILLEAEGVGLEVAQGLAQGLGPIGGLSP